jgi:hypothetical protein
MTGLYRISSGEVVKFSVANQLFTDRDTSLWGVLNDPPTPDGTETRDPNGDLRVLGYAKILDSGTVRNATQPEIDSFSTSEDADDSIQDRDAAIVLFQAHPAFRKLMTAYSDIVKDEINGLRQWIVQYKAAVAAANNLGTLKTSVANLPDLPDRTLAQLKTAIQNRISEND